MAMAEATIARKPGSKREVVLTASHAVYHLRANTEQELMSWLISLQLAKANVSGGGHDHAYDRGSGGGGDSAVDMSATSEFNLTFDGSRLNAVPFYDEEFGITRA